jgi:ribosome biogenesis GTPase
VSRRRSLEGVSVEGTVVEIHGMRATVFVHQDGQRLRCRPLRDRTQLAVGDRVEVVVGRHGAEVAAMAPRRRTLWRPREHGNRPMASHVDRLIVVGAVEPALSPGFIDRILVAADAEDIPSVLLLNKSDLQGEAYDRARVALEPYEAMGYAVLLVSAHTGSGLDAVEAQCAEGLSVFVGHSGVGKSSILNALLPDAELETGDLNAITRKGRHTTTVSTCHPLGRPWPEGALLVDTPGVRAFGLYGLEPVDVAYGFRELRPYRTQCHYRDCLHRKEPGCVVRTALEEGDVRASRYESYLRILDSVERGEG